MATRRIKLRILCVLVVLAITATTAAAQDFINQHVVPNSLQVLKIEEDWELSVASPGVNVTAPQVTTAISPLGHVESLHAIFNLNYQALDTFSPGGMQLQLWNGKAPISHHKLRSGDVLQTPGEVVTWTQQMSISNGQVTFNIVNGQSETWGEFGNDGALTERVHTSLVNLNGYDPVVSIDSSGTGFASNRVNWLKLKCVRAYTDDDQVFAIDVNLNVDTVDVE